MKKHHCSKINIVLNRDREVISMQALQAYIDILGKYGIAFEEKRTIYQSVSIQNGRTLFHIFKQREIMDADAVLCVHDVPAIGLCMEMEERGYQIPDDLLICSLNCSMNSVVFRPDITGADRMDKEISEKACSLLIDLIHGKEVPLDNYCRGEIYYGSSCGCNSRFQKDSSKWHQQLIVSKIEAGNQISRMMQFNDNLEKVNSLDELGENIKCMLEGINCSEFFAA